MLRLTDPRGGAFRALAGELAGKFAEYRGSPDAGDAAQLRHTVDGVAAQGGRRRRPDASIDAEMTGLPDRGAARCAVVRVGSPTPADVLRCAIDARSMRLFNTLTRREEDFAPCADNTVRMYTCGLTVYARGHIGNFRTFVALDVLRRALKYRAATRCSQVLNFTDVDDRTIAERAKAGRAAARVHASSTSTRSARTRRRSASSRSKTRRAPPTPSRAMADMIQRARARTATPTRATARSTSRSRRFPSTASSRGSITAASRAARASTPTSTTRKTRATSCCGRRPSRASRRGSRRRPPAGRAGTSSARRWRAELLGEPPSISMAAASTCLPASRERDCAERGRHRARFARFWVHIEQARRLSQAHNRVATPCSSTRPSAQLTKPSPPGRTASRPRLPPTHRPTRPHSGTREWLSSSPAPSSRPSAAQVSVRHRVDQQQGLLLVPVHHRAGDPVPGEPAPVRVVRCEQDD